MNRAFLNTLLSTMSHMAEQKWPDNSKLNNYLNLYNVGEFHVPTSQSGVDPPGPSVQTPDRS